MADNQLISLWSPGERAGALRLGESLGELWAQESRSVIVVDASAGGSSIENPAAWIASFKTLDPPMLRNSLASGSGYAAQLALDAALPGALLAEIFMSLKRAFEKLLVIGPATLSPECAPLLDASDFLLWYAAEAECSSFRPFLDRLSALHFPHAYCHVAIRGASSKSRGTVQGKTPLQWIDDSGSRARWTESVRSLARELEQAQLSKAAPLSDRVSDAASVAQQIRQRIEPTLLKSLATHDSLEAGEAQRAVEACVAQDTSLPAAREIREGIVTRVMDDVMGLGPLEPLLKDPAITEVMVNSHRCIFVERKGKLHSSDVQISSEQQLRTIIDRIIAPIGRRVDESMPLCDARLADGSRVNIVIPPLALDGPTITIRKFPSKTMSLDDLVALGSLNTPMSNFLKACIAHRRNIVVAGGTGSGKTTLLNALSSAIPDEDRIITIEDAAELRLQKPHVIRLESRPPNAEGQGAIPIRRLVMNALRMRPDRIVIGECRGGEALDMLQAMNTGHDGSLTTVHANSPRDALGRLETLVLLAGIDLPVKVVREQIRSAVHLIVQQARLGDGSRKIISITEVTGMEGDTLLTQELFSFHEKTFKASGLLPQFNPSENRP